MKVSAVSAVVDSPRVTTSPSQKFFEPYIDVALWEQESLSTISQKTHIQGFVLAFIVGNQDKVSWAGVIDINNDIQPHNTTIAEEVKKIQSQGGRITISFGGANGAEPAYYIQSVPLLVQAYQSVIDRYNIQSLDFDIEGAHLQDTATNHRRNQAIVELQKKNPQLRVTFTLPVLPTGLTLDGITVLKQAKQDGVVLQEVNIMAMDYGTSVDSGDMGKDAIRASKATIAQLKQLQISAQIGITPMIGINDVTTEVFTLEDAQELVDFVKQTPEVAGIHMWSIGRDNGRQIGQVSPTSSGYTQKDYEFSQVFNQIIYA